MYYSLKNGKLVTERQIKDAITIVNGIEVADEDFEEYIKNLNGIDKKIEKPKLEKMVANGQINMAARIFAEQNKSVEMTEAEARKFLINKYGKKE